MNNDASATVGQGSLMHVGREGRPMWSDPINNLLSLRLLRKLMLVLIERYHNYIKWAHQQNRSVLVSSLVFLFVFFKAT